MKNLLLITLFISFVACGGKITPKHNKDPEKPSMPYVTVPANGTDGGTSAGGSEGRTTFDGTEGESTTGDETPLIKDKTYRCNISNQNESTTLEIEVKDEGSSKVAVLNSKGQDGKFIFDGFTLSPSNNENASVSHPDPDSLVEGGKVLKISARITMNEEILEGELQVSYKVKNQDKSVTEAEFKKLADINSCILK
jgi:hypothetical protein